MVELPAGSLLPAGPGRPRVGLGWRAPLAGWVASQPPEVECLELVAEHFFASGQELLAELGARWPVFVHGLGLSLGSPGPLDPHDLARFARVAELTRAAWASEHVAFTRTAQVDLGHLCPVAPTRQNVERIASHARQVADACGRPVLLENITSHLRLQGELDEPEFLNAVCERGGCGLLLDVTNLYVNARNHRFDPLRWLHALEGARIRQLHVVGYAREQGRLEDHHGHDLQPELLDLVQAACAHGAVEAVVLERDAHIPAPAHLREELLRVRASLMAPVAPSAGGRAWS